MIFDIFSGKLCKYSTFNSNVFRATTTRIPLKSVQIMVNEVSANGILFIECTLRSEYILLFFMYFSLF